MKTTYMLTGGGVAVVALLALAATLARPALAGSGDHYGDRYDWRVKIGFRIAPVPLNLDGKDRELVGLGSYLVNAVGDCNGCHTASPPQEYAPGGNPHFGQPKVVDQTTYLGGGYDFGPLIPGTAHIVSRNLTPDKTGRPEGGRTLEEFREIMRTGVDLDHLHPTCAADPATWTSDCVPPPFNGDLLQIMPWPNFQNMSDHDLRAIYEYLSAIPCIEGPPTGVLHNDCT
jgi:hypothetical protein